MCSEWREQNFCPKSNPADILLFKLEQYSNLLKVNNKDTRTTPLAGVFIFNFEQISHIALLFSMLPSNKYWYRLSNKNAPYFLTFSYTVLIQFFCSSFTCFSSLLSRNRIRIWLVDIFLKILLFFWSLRVIEPPANSTACFTRLYCNKIEY